MDKVTLDVYLFFKGECKEAMEFYKSVFGGKLELSTYGESPGQIEGNKDWIMHARLHDGDINLMASDTQKASSEAKKITLALGGTDEKHITELFNKLSAGGKVISPLKKEFWGDIYGQFTDKFGIEWMVNISKPKS